MKLVVAIVFVLAFAAWCYLEFIAAEASEGLKDILFWIGMFAVLIGYDAKPEKA